MSNLGDVRDIFTDGPVGKIAKSVIGAQARPVRAIGFDKSMEANWALDWHQDRTIHVKSKMEVEGFGPWTTKAGMTHVAPPQTLLDQMITLRVHLDDVGAQNAPLLVAAGTHRFGRIAESEIDDLVKSAQSLACLADAGDVWVYSTPILHASERARAPSRRRVIQVDYAAFDLPGQMSWGLRV